MDDGVKRKTLLTIRDTLFIASAAWDPRENKRDIWGWKEREKKCWDNYCCISKVKKRKNIKKKIGENESADMYILILCIYIRRYIYLQSNKLTTVAEGDLKAPFSIATTSRCKGGHYFFPRIAPLYP